MKTGYATDSVETTSGLFGPIESPATPTLPDVPLHRHARRTERAAADRIRPIVKSLRVRVLDWIRESGEQGLTAAEAGMIYAESRGRHPLDGSSRNSVGPRFTELARSGYIRESEHVRDHFAAYVWTGKAGDGSDAR